jgi:hypothetical protein
MSVWLIIFLPILVTIILLVFFRKKIVLWEILALIIPSALLILIMNTIMIHSLTTDTQYLGAYIPKVYNYKAWDEKVSCRHPIYCSRSCGKNCTTTYVCGHVHAFDVDYHPEYWTKEDNYGREYIISKYEYTKLSKQFENKENFIDMHRDYYSIDGDALCVHWNNKPETADAVTLTDTYENKIKASHSIFKFEEVSDKSKLAWGLYDYPEIPALYQPCVLGRPISIKANRKFQYINGYYGVNKQFKLFILFFKDQSIESAFKQRSYWEGGNKNELVVCVGTNKSGKLQWCKSFSWMDKPELEVRIDGFMNKYLDRQVDLDKFADWLPKEIEQHWKRKEFKDFDYLTIEVTTAQLIWILVIIGLYNIGMSIWIVINEFENEN